MDKCWERLSNHESLELVKRDYRSRHGKTPSSEHAREIAAPFLHARSYFRAAAGADRNVKPLLVYYGVLSLCRGLTLSLARGRREATLAPGHGVATKNWGADLSKSNPDFAALRIVVTSSGSLIELAEATRHRSLLRMNSSATNVTHENPPLSVGATFTLGDFLERIPPIQEHHRLWRNVSRCVPLHIEKSEKSEERARLRVVKTGRPHVTREFCDSLFTGTGFEYVVEWPEHFLYAGPGSLNALPGLTDAAHAGFTAVGDTWLTARYPGDIKLSKLVTMFCVSYVLGMLVRYFPNQWTALVGSQIDDAALPTLWAVVELVETEVPQIVLDFLSDERSHRDDADSA